MNKTIVGLGIGVLLVGGIGALVYYEKQDSLSPAPLAAAPQAQGTQQESLSESAPKNLPPEPQAPQPEQSAAGITAEEVARHSTRMSCWSTINGSVYDLTSWIPNHPGGEAAIVQLCGTDGSAKFNGKHGGAERQLTVLAGFRIGIAAQ